MHQIKNSCEKWDNSDHDSEVIFHPKLFLLYKTQDIVGDDLQNRVTEIEETDENFNQTDGFVENFYEKINLFFDKLHNFGKTKLALSEEISAECGFLLDRLSKLVPILSC